LDLSMWKASASQRLSPEQLADFNEAYQEIKFEIMAEGTASGGPAEEAAALEKVNGKTVRSVLQLGLGRELRRLEYEQNQRLQSIKFNAGIATRPDDTRSQRYLEEIHEHQLQRLRDEALEIERVKARLAAAGPVSDAPAPTMDVQPTLSPTKESNSDDF